MKEFILWGLTASPYQLKMQALLDAADEALSAAIEAGGDKVAVVPAREPVLDEAESFDELEV